MTKLKESKSSLPEYSCRYCGKVYQRETGLAGHSCSLAPIQNDEGYQCRKCDRVFKREGSWSRHDCIPVVKTVSHKCPYCSKSYAKEKTLYTHVCKQKKRHYERETPPARIAFRAYTLFIKMNYRSEPTYEKFAQSDLYDAFLRFGRYIIDVDAISPIDFIEYMLKSGVPIDRWCRDSEYERYVRQHTMKESPMRALERTALLMKEWGIKYDSDPHLFFLEIAHPLAVQWICSGRISPWVMLNCATGQALVRRFTDEQLSMVAEALNTKLWQGKFNRFPNEVAEIQAALKAEGL